MEPVKIFSVYSLLEYLVLFCLNECCFESICMLLFSLLPALASSLLLPSLDH